MASFLPGELDDLSMQRPWQGRNITFPIYSGMTYVSGLYQGYTPQITSTRAIVAVDWVRNGTWSLRNNGGKEFRLYALQLDGHFVDTWQGPLDFPKFRDRKGVLFRPLSVAEISE